MSEGINKKASFFEKISPFLVVIIILLAFAVGALWQKVANLEKGGTAKTATTDTGTQAQPTIDISQIKGLFGKDLIKFGDEKRKLLIVEVSDPSCPYCHVAGGKDGELNKQIGDRFTLVADGGTYLAPVPEFKKLIDAKKASFVYIYQNGHGNGELAMKALYCAFEKDKFWEVHDLLYTNKGYNLINNEVKNDVTQAGKLADFLKGAINASDMKTCLESGRYDKRLTSDEALATSLGISGTPGFYLNATNFAGAYSYTDMKTVVDAAL